MKTLYTIREAAGLLGVHVETLRRAVRQGQLRASRAGRSYTISRSALESYYRATGGGALFDQGPLAPKASTELKELWAELRDVVAPVELSEDAWSMFVEEWKPPFLREIGSQVAAVEFNQLALVLWGSSMGFYLFAMPLDRFVKIKARYLWAFNRGARAARAILKKEE